MVRILIIVLFTGFAQAGTLEISGSFSKPLINTTKIDSSKTGIDFNRLSIKYKHFKRISFQFIRFSNDSSVKIQSLVMNYEYEKRMGRLLLLSNVGIGFSAYTEHTPLQPNLSMKGFTLNGEMNIGYKVLPTIAIIGGVYYSYSDFSASFLGIPKNFGIKIQQGGLKLGLIYEW